MATLPGLRVGVSLDSATFIREQRRIQGEVRTMGRTIQRQNELAQASFSRVTKAAGLLRTGLAGLGLGIASAGFSSLVRGALDSADALAKQSRQLGLSIEALQAYQRGAELAGVSQDLLRTSLEAFTRRLGEAANGEGELLSAIERTGISLRTQAGEMRSTNELFRAFADEIAGAESATEAAATAADAFGRSGVRMVEFLRSGSAGLEAMEENLRASVHVTTEQAAAIERFNDRLTEASHTMETSWTAALGEAIIVGERWSKQFDSFSAQLRDFFGITDEMAAEWGKGWLPATEAVSEFDRMINELLADARPATRVVEDQATALENLGSAASRASEGVTELTARQERLAEAGKFLTTTSALEERFDHEAEAAAQAAAELDKLVAEQSRQAAEMQRLVEVPNREASSEAQQASAEAFRRVFAA